MAMTFLTAAIISSAVFVVLMVQTRDRVRAVETE